MPRFAQATKKSSDQGYLEEMNVVDEGQEEQPVPSRDMEIDHHEEEVAVAPLDGFLPIKVPENDDDLNIPEKCPDDLTYKNFSFQIRPPRLLRRLESHPLQRRFLFLYSNLF